MSGADAAVLSGTEPAGPDAAGGLGALAVAGAACGGEVMDRLFGEGHRFDFYQAVSLLQALRPDAVPVGVGSDPGGEAVRFGSAVGLGFPASDVAGVAPPAVPGEAARMQVSFMGLAGAHGPLPNAVTEVIMERLARKDRTFAAFLDIFNHRLISLQYRVRAENRPGLAQEAPPASRAARYLFALIGLGTPQLQGRMGIEDRALLGYASVLAGTLRSQSGLETLLTRHFGVPVAVEAFRGSWLPIPAEERTRLGRFGRNHGLGRDAVLGSRVWDQQGRFTVVIGPLPLREFLAFLPVNDRFRPLVALCRLYAGEEFDFDVELQLNPQETPQAVLGASTGSLLGWTSWLRRPDGEAARPSGTIRLAGRREGTLPGAPA